MAPRTAPRITTQFDVVVQDRIGTEVIGTHLTYTSALFAVAQYASDNRGELVGVDTDTWHLHQVGITRKIEIQRIESVEA